MKLIALALIPLTTLAFQPDVIIDANNPVLPATVTLTGAWANEVAPNLANAFRGDSKVAFFSSASTYAAFKTRLPKSGPYSVFVWHNGGTSNFSYTASVQVTHADVATTAVTLNQYSNAGQWLLIGTFWFDGDDDGLSTCKQAEVRVSGHGNMKLSADAVRFAAAAPDLVLDSDVGGSAVAFTPNATTWSSFTDKAGNFGNVRRAGSTSGGAVSYTFPVLVSGDYDLSLWLPGTGGTWLTGGLNPATSFTVEIQHPTVAGQNPVASTSVIVNLPTVGTHEGQWVRVVNPATASDDAPRTGSFRFKPSAANLVNKVTIKTVGATGAGVGPWQVPADAVRLSKVGDWAAFMDEDDSSFPPVPGVSGTTNWTNNSAIQMARPWAEWSKGQYGPAWKSFNFTSTTQGPASMTYSPLIPELGLYDIYLWYPAQNGYTTTNSGATKLSIQTALGPVLGSLNQKVGTGMWRHVGRHILFPSDYSDPALQPKVTVATPANPYAAGTYEYTSWWSPNQGNVLSDGVMFLRDAEGIDSDGDGVMDWFETLVGTNSGNTDSNANGVNDYLELTPTYFVGFAPMAVTVSQPAGALIY